MKTIWLAILGLVFLLKCKYDNKKLRRIWFWYLYANGGDIEDVNPLLKTIWLAILGKNSIWNFMLSVGLNIDF